MIRSKLLQFDIDNHDGKQQITQNKQLVLSRRPFKLVQICEGSQSRKKNHQREFPTESTSQTQMQFQSIKSLLIYRIVSTPVKNGRAMYLLCYNYSQTEPFKFCQYWSFSPNTYISPYFPAPFTDYADNISFKQHWKSSLES